LVELLQRCARIGELAVALEGEGGLEFIVDRSGRVAATGFGAGVSAESVPGRNPPTTRLTRPD